ncbi:hypothetical protein Tco_0060124 [Tanacetum coccineum]
MFGRKRAGKEQQQESSKKQKVEEEKESDEVEEVDEDDEAELKNHLVIKKDEDIAIDAIPLATKFSSDIDYKLHKEGRIVGLKRLQGFLEVTTAQGDGTVKGIIGDEMGDGSSDGDGEIGSEPDVYSGEGGVCTGGAGGG